MAMVSVFGSLAWRLKVDRLGDAPGAASAGMTPSAAAPAPAAALLATNRRRLKRRETRSSTGVRAIGFS
jgi:hypothetical protein